MSWVREEDNRTLVQRGATHLLKQGPIPQHVGFILDGNRRYAKGRNLKPVEGHVQGFDKLSETLKWCKDLGIHEVTVYVFSIENFKRAPEEVDGLMRLAKDKFQKLLEEEKRLMEDGICIQIVGDWTLVPPELRPLMAKAMTLTRYNTRAKLNVAFAYTSRNEITRGIKAIHEGLTDGDILEGDVSPSLLEESFYILPSKPLDLLVRTSGETRLSDFLLWQSTQTVLCFSDVLWPEFTYWNLLRVVFKFQIDKLNLNHQNLKHKEPVAQDLSVDKRRKEFIHKIREKQWQLLLEEASQVPVSP